jgi:nucleotide-binding universal stress UspA family protein
VKRVLLSTDFSDNAASAIEYALRLFGSDQVNYYLLNSYSLVSNVPEMLISLEDILHEQSEKGLARTLDRIKKEHQTLDIETLSVYGDAHSTIKKIADDRGVDLVVLGNKGDLLDEAIYGRTATQLVNRVNQPMLVVPQNCKCEEPRKILLATDLNQIEDLSVLDSMLGIARKFNAEVVVLNVSRSSDKQKVQQAIRRLDFNNHFEGISSRFEVVDNDDIIDGINEYSKGHHADLLVLFPKRYPYFKNLFHKSVTKNILRHSDIPIMVI